jgi:hypothetical protein
MKYAVVTWGDAHGGADHWSEFDEDMHKPRPVTSCGHVIKDDAVGVSLSLNYDTDGEAIDTYIFIPRAMVIGTTYLEPADVRVPTWNGASS